MAITTDAFQAAVMKGGARCQLALYLKTRPDHERKAIFAALADHAVSCGTILRVLAKHDFKHGINGIRAHRREGCRTCKLGPGGVPLKGSRR